MITSIWSAFSQAFRMLLFFKSAYRIPVMRSSKICGVRPLLSEEMPVVRLMNTTNQLDKLRESRWQSARLVDFLDALRIEVLIPKISTVLQFLSQSRLTSTVPPSPHPHQFTQLYNFALQSSLIRLLKKLTSKY